jgi:hypothetical protein
MTEYMEFVEIRDTGKTKIFDVRSKSSGDQLGTIKWYGPWRQYTFHPIHATVFNIDCLSVIVTFIQGLMTERKRAKMAAAMMTNCCGGEPKTCSTCEECGCVEGGNASFTCWQHAAKVAAR